MWRFFKDFLIYGVASVLGKIAAIFLMPVYTSILTKEEYGAIALITSCKGIIDLVSNLNIHSGIARDYYEDGVNRKKLVSTGLLSILSLSLTILMIGVLTNHFWSGQVLGLKEEFWPAFTVMLYTIPAGSLMSYFAILTRFRKKPVQYSLGTILQIIVQIGVSVIGVVILRVGIISVFLGFLISEIIAVAYFAFLNREYVGFQFDNVLLRRALVFAIPTLPAIMAGWLDSSMGQILIGKYVSVEELGVYSVALSLASVFTLIGTAFHNVWSPFLYENYNMPFFQEQVRRLFVILVLCLTSVSVTLSLFSKEIILLLSNANYLEASKYLTLLCIPMCMYLMFPIASSGVNISRKTKYVALAYILGSIVNLSFLFLTIPRLGVISVPICLGVSRIVTYSYLYLISSKSLNIDLPNHMFGIFILFVIGCYFIISVNMSLVGRLLISIAILAGLFVYAYKAQGLKDVISNFLTKNNTSR